VFNLKVAVKFRVFGFTIGQFQHVWSIPVPIPVPAAITLVNFDEDGVTITATVGPVASGAA